MLNVLALKCAQRKFKTNSHIFVYSSMLCLLMNSELGLESNHLIQLSILPDLGTRLVAAGSTAGSAAGCATVVSAGGAPAVVAIVSAVDVVTVIGIVMILSATVLYFEILRISGI